MTRHNNELSDTRQDDTQEWRHDSEKGTKLMGNSHLLRAFAVIATVLLGAVVLGGPSDAQTTPSLSFVTPREEPVTVQLEELEDQDSKVEDQNSNLQGELDAVLLNDSNYEGSLIVEFIPKDAEGPTALGLKPDFPQGRLGFFTTLPKKPSASPFATTQVPLRFGTAAPLQEPVDGVVVARASDGAQIRPATLRVRVAAPTALGRWSKARLVPSTVTINTTLYTPTPLRRFVQPSAFGLETPVWVRSLATGTAVQAGQEVATTRLSSGTGGDAKATLLFEEGIPNEAQGEVEGIVRATEVQRAGSYEGTLAVDPAVATAPTATVKLRVQDLWVWPLLAIFAGAWVARYFGNWRDQGRLKNLLVAELGLAFRRYKADRNTFRDPPYTLNYIFGDNDKLNLDCPPPQDPSKAETPPRDPPRAKKVYCNTIKVAKTREDLQDAIAEVRDIQQVVALWPDVCRAATELRAALKDLPQEGEQIRAAAEGLLVKTPPADAKATKERLELYRRQTRAVGVWMQGWKVYEAADRLYHDLEDPPLPKADERKRQDNNPGVVLDTYLKPVTSLEELAENAAVAQLRESYRVLRTLALIYPAARRVGAAAVDEVAGRPTAPLTDVAETFRHYASPGEIVAMVRSRDLLDFLATFLLTALAFLVTIYVGKDFGSTWQYLTAFLAGATGQVAVNWALLPWYRSYRVAAAPPTATSS